jgi:axial budding pattern protein 2
LMPVANIGNNYQYQINPITYVSDDDNGNSKINYSISGLDWLKFDNENRTLYGTPTEQGLYNFTLSGYNQYSSISNLYNIIVQQQDNTTLNQFIFQNQLKSFGVTNGNNGIVVKPGSEFYYKFDNSIFNDVGNAQFFGRLADHSSLPNWINFNGDDLSFSGTAPYVTSEIAPSIKYQFSIIASTNGFSLAEGFFDLIIGANQLWVNDSMITYNGTFNQDVELQLPLNQVFLNGDQIAISNVSLIKPENLPNYLNF